MTSSPTSPLVFLPHSPLPRDIPQLDGDASISNDGSDAGDRIDAGDRSDAGDLSDGAVDRYYVLLLLLANFTIVA